MSGDDKAKHDDPAHAGSDPSPKPHPIEEPGTTEKPEASSQTHSSEWTASDARGPLSASSSSPLVADESASATNASGYHATGFDRETTTAAPDISEKPAEAPEVEPAPASATSEPAAPASAKPRKSNVWPIAAGIVLGAVIGAGSAYYIDMSKQGGAATTQDMAALTSRLDTLEKSGGPLKTSLAELGAKVSAAEASARAAEASAAETTKTVAQATSGAGQTDKIAAMQGTLTALQSRSDEVSSGVKAMEDKIAALEATIAALQKTTATAQSDLSTMRNAQKSLEAKITNAPAFAVIADSLIRQIERGAPFESEVSALEAFGADPTKIAALRPIAPQGVLPIKVLAQNFDAIADALLVAAHKTPGNPGFWDRIKSEAGSLVTIRRDGESGTGDVAAGVAAIKAALAQGDAAAAHAAFLRLPTEAKTKREAVAWDKSLAAHAEASQTAHALETEAMASLGVKKS